jgi:DNA-directed RNA polymerase subunit RPC12/RpoP
MKRGVGLKYFVIALFFLSASTYLVYSYALSVSDIVEEVSPSIVMIVVYDITGSEIGQGSGFFVNKNGAIFTNAHVLKKAYSAKVLSAVGTFTKIQLLYQDPQKDLAAIKVEAKNAQPLDIDFEEDLKPGDRVIAIGNPLGLEKTVSDGLVSAIRNTKSGVELIQTTAPISPGSSGGPLLDLKGSVDGITSSTFLEGQNLNFAISAKSIGAFLDDFKNKKETGELKYQELKPAGESVWYRVILKWVGNIFLFLIAVLFGGAYYIIGLIILAVYIVYLIIRALWKLFSHPFRGKTRPYQTPISLQPPSNQSTLIGLGTQNGDYRPAKEEPDLNSLLVFHCWKCGHKHSLVESMKGQEIECQSCHTRLIVPNEKGEVLPPKDLKKKEIEIGWTNAEERFVSIDEIRETGGGIFTDDKKRELDNLIFETINEIQKMGGALLTDDEKKAIGRIIYDTEIHFLSGSKIFSSRADFNAFLDTDVKFNAKCSKVDFEKVKEAYIIWAKKFHSTDYDHMVAGS